MRVERGEHLERVALALPDHPLEQLEGGGEVAPVDGVGEVPRRHAAVVAEERLDVVDGEPGARAVGGAQQVDAGRASRLGSSPTQVTSRLAARRRRP